MTPEDAIDAHLDQWTPYEECPACHIRAALVWNLYEARYLCRECNEAWVEEFYPVEVEELK